MIDEQRDSAPQGRANHDTMREALARQVANAKPGHDSLGSFGPDGLVVYLSPEQRDLIVAALSAPQGGEWQPIETAPKDGTSVDLFVPGMARYANARWNAQEYTFEAPWGWGNYQMGRITGATHWMPLPAPPLVNSHGNLTTGAQ